MQIKDFRPSRETNQQRLCPIGRVAGDVGKATLLAAFVAATSSGCASSSGYVHSSLKNAAETIDSSSPGFASSILVVGMTADDKPRTVCNAVVIRQDAVLTAAHCFPDHLPVFVLAWRDGPERTGLPSEGEYLSGYEMLPLLEIRRHPEFQERRYDMDEFDVAIGSLAPGRSIPARFKPAQLVEPGVVLPQMPIERIEREQLLYRRMAQQFASIEGAPQVFVPLSAPLHGYWEEYPYLSEARGSFVGTSPSSDRFLYVPKYSNLFIEGHSGAGVFLADGGQLLGITTRSTWESYLMVAQDVRPIRPWIDSTLASMTLSH